MESISDQVVMLLLPPRLVLESSRRTRVGRAAQLLVMESVPQTHAPEVTYEVVVESSYHRHADASGSFRSSKKVVSSTQDESL